MAAHARRPSIPAGEAPAVPLNVLLVLLILFVGSGCAALIYEIVWLQMLQLVIGSTAHSLGVLLGTFMGGMCLGSIGFARVVSPRRHPLVMYALLELGIAVIGLALIYLLPYVGRLYMASAAGGTSAILLRAGVSALCLLPPTILMGATLPSIARWVESTPQGVSRLGFFYGANIAGAVFGCLLAGFYLLRVHDAVVATYVAAAINILVATVGLALAAAVSYQPRVSETAGQWEATPTRWAVYAAIGLSGMTALGAEVVWTRLLSLLLGATVYTFSIILAVFLFGLGIGSSIGSLLARSSTSGRAALGVCQLLLTAAIAWTAYALTRLLPYWPIDVRLTPSPWIGFQLDLVRCMWAMLPAALLWGASFPLALAAAASRSQDPGRLVGGVYAANTVGAIAGSLLFSMLAISWFGTQRAHQVLICLAAVASVLMLGPLLWQAVRSRGTLARCEAGLGSLGLAAALAGVAFFTWSVPSAPPGLVAYGRNLPAYKFLPDFLYMAEGMNASIAVSEESDGARNFHVSGKVVASSLPQDMRLQRMMCHVPALVHPAPKTVLVVGCGAGVTAGTFVVHPGIERIVVCEIEPLIPPAAAKYFAYENYDFLKDPRVEIVYDDARHYIAASREKFDIITSDPIHPWVKGAAALYSEEYFELCKGHLSQGGVVAQWVPLYETNQEAVNSQIGTFIQSFPEGTIWSNDNRGEGYDVVLLGQVGPTKIDIAALMERLDQEDHGRVRASLEEVELGSAVALLRTYAGQGRDLTRWLDGRYVNRDHNLRLQYLAGMNPNSYISDDIFRSIVHHRRYPENLFIASGGYDTELRRHFKPPQPN
jgi:spermidine synthase